MFPCCGEIKFLNIDSEKMKKNICTKSSFGLFINQRSDWPPDICFPYIWADSHRQNPNESNSGYLKNVKVEKLTTG